MIKVSYDNKKMMERFSRETAIKLQEDIDSKIMKDISPYVPKDSGNLLGSMRRSSPGEITWNTPYARVAWYGKSKYGKDLQFKQSSGLEGPRWTERYSANNFNSIRELIVRRYK